MVVLGNGSETSDKGDQVDLDPRGPDPSAGELPEGALRIDDLARLSGTTVDTVRFYQREGLLPPATRRGRALLYGPEHLERLERIHDLQARHFSLKSIRAVVDEGRLQLLDQLFGGQKRSFTREELIAESGLEPGHVAILEAGGIPDEPAGHGARAYDGDDLALLSSLRSSLDRGMPTTVATLLLQLFTRHLDALRQDVFDIFNVGGTGLGPALTEEDLDTFRTVAANAIDEFLQDTSIWIDYLYRRGVQRLVVEAMDWEDVAEDGVPAGGQ